MNEEEPNHCTHPDHKDGKTCIDHAVGCSPTCVCCLGEVLVKLNQKETEEHK